MNRTTEYMRQQALSLIFQASHLLECADEIDQAALPDNPAPLAAYHCYNHYYQKRLGLHGDS